MKICFVERSRRHDIVCSVTYLFLLYLIVIFPIDTSARHNSGYFTQTFKRRANHCPSFDGTEAQILSEGQFQVKQRNSTGYQCQKIWN